MDILYQYLPIEIVDIIMRKVHEMNYYPNLYQIWKKNHRRNFLKVVKELDEINYKLMSSLYNHYSLERTYLDVEDYFYALDDYDCKIWGNKSEMLIDIVQRSAMAEFLLNL